MNTPLLMSSRSPQADWVIDLGPEGGEKGGQIIAQGTPVQIALIKESYTGLFLKA